MYALVIFSHIYSLKGDSDIWGGTYIKWFLTFQTSRNESSSLFMSRPLYILPHEVYCVSLFIVAWHLAVREVRSTRSLGISEPLKRLPPSFFHSIVSF